MINFTHAFALAGTQKVALVTADADEKKAKDVSVYFHGIGVQEADDMYCLIDAVKHERDLARIAGEGLLLMADRNDMEHSEAYDAYKAKVHHGTLDDHLEIRRLEQKSEYLLQRAKESIDLSDEYRKHRNQLFSVYSFLTGKKSEVHVEYFTKPPVTVESPELSSISPEPPLQEVRIPMGMPMDPDTIIVVRDGVQHLHTGCIIS